MVLPIVLLFLFVTGGEPSFDSSVQANTSSTSSWTLLLDPTCSPSTQPTPMPTSMPTQLHLQWPSLEPSSYPVPANKHTSKKRSSSSSSPSHSIAVAVAVIFALLFLVLVLLGSRVYSAGRRRFDAWTLSGIPLLAPYSTSYERPVPNFGSDQELAPFNGLSYEPPIFGDTAIIDGDEEPTDDGQLTMGHAHEDVETSGSEEGTSAATDEIFG